MLKMSQELKNYIDELDRRDVRLEGTGGKEIDGAIFERLLSLGVLIPYADAFSFDDKGVLLVGKAGVGKSPIVEKFLQLYGRRAVILAVNNPVVYNPATYRLNEQTKPVVYLDDIGSQEIPFFAPFLLDAPEDFQEFQLGYIFNLKPGSGVKIREGSIESAIDEMVSWPKTQQSSQRLREMFTQVKCYNVPAAKYQLGVSSQDKVSKRFCAAADQNLGNIVKSMVELITSV